MTDPALTLAGALPKSPSDHGPIGVPSDTVRALLEADRFPQRYIVNIGSTALIAQAAEAFQALAQRIWSGDSPMGCGDVHTVADLDAWVSKLPEDEAAAFNAMLGEGFASRYAWDSDHPVSEWVRRTEEPGPAAIPDGGT